MDKLLTSNFYGYALRTLCLSEARHQLIRTIQDTPVCVSEAHLGRGYGKFSLSEAGTL